ncbi:hypothetical protein AB0A05_07310 [Streptomyces sp. NPDC046374]|uniref:hypothetical protein n=1 Tax=Streptomyces sp. NPDC046374 TaxID=3154917 RepID=UPI0033C5016C
MKLPRVRCEKCERAIAAGPVAGRLSKGRLWRHDPPVVHRQPGVPLVSCIGSLEIVDLPYGQMEITIDEPEPADAAQVDDPVLF